ncbi:MAG TPA: hypothetical protein DCE56_17820 [Cyanobacteria bacterium UBA8553]|nr:hypothetical protein [Cyanobacteria bacterium UBA8553]HAJ62288.1 hypothetical protein [Cyanobacteria bacterium UBA8543]
MRTNRKILGAVGAGILLVGGGAIWFKAMATEAFLHNSKTSVSLVQAVETVLAANPGTTAVDATLAKENNKRVWEVKLNNDLEIYIDANTNQIVRTEQGWNLTDVPFLGAWIPIE